MIDRSTFDQARDLISLLIQRGLSSISTISQVPSRKAAWKRAKELSYDHCFETNIGTGIVNAIKEQDRVYQPWTILFFEEDGSIFMLFCFSTNQDAIWAKMLS